jgi:hypothetical protein
MIFNRKKGNPNDLIAKWNTDGRRYITDLNKVIAKSYEGREVSDNWPKDPRTAKQARLVISLVEAEEQEGRWCAEKPIADRGHEPFIDMLNDVCQSLNCVSILGSDEFLVRLGTAYQPGPTMHIRGAQVIERPDILAVAVSRNRDLLLLVQKQGFNVTRRLDEEPIARFAWPEGVTPEALDIVQISNDGNTIAFVSHDNAVWLGQMSGTDSAWTCVYPTPSFLDMIKEEGDDMDDEENPWYDSMMHCGLSPDGKFIAYGSQCYGHFIDHIAGIGEIESWAEIGHLSEYPHYACFSDDGAFAALNSCHFYHGATVCVRIADVEGMQTDPYEENKSAPLINDRLRVYAATWLPSGENDNGSFALGGSSYLDIVSTDGTVLSTTYFGSSASSIDYCPKTGLLAVASYSGFLHIFALSQTAEEGKAIGYRPIHEQYRWVFWRDRAPFRW